MFLGFRIHMIIRISTKETMKIITTSLVELLRTNDISKNVKELFKYVKT